MKKICLLIVTFLLVSVVLTAQDFPKVELFGGYQLLGASDGAASGWAASVAGNFNKYFGVEGRFSGAYSTWGNNGLYTVLLGPRLTVRGKKTTGFAHFLFGGDQVGSVNRFVWAVGGGVDVDVHKHVAIRPVEFDYMQVDLNIDCVLYSAGVVFKF
jgi:opacity protein-like surface antigen